MYEYERSYKTGRAVTSCLEVFGWVIVVLGVIVALIGFATGGVMGMASRGFGGGDAPALFRIISTIPGIIIAAGGLLSVMLAQHTKATIDTSEMTRELLAIAKGNPERVSEAQSLELVTADSKTDTVGYIEINDGSGKPRKVEENDGAFLMTTLSGQKKKFSTLEEVREYIS